MLPATGALLFYYLSQITAEKLFTSYGLVIAIGYFGLSLLIGLWNAFSLATQYEGGENAEWTGGDIIHALFFGAQFVCFIIGVGLVMCFFFTVSLNVESLLKKAS